MSESNKYILDTNVFIQANRQYYRSEICPGFWVSLIQAHQAERLFSIDRVKDEISNGTDSLTSWSTDEVPKTFFEGTADKAVVESFQEMMNWVDQQEQYFDSAKTEFASIADGWLVAHARVNDLVVVTHEVFAEDVKRKIPIPNLCLEFNVEYTTTYDMLEELEIQFVLKDTK